jgi:protein-S-isoprenylcysteine O-methyltransferase Ste14
MEAMDSVYSLCCGRTCRWITRRRAGLSVILAVVALGNALWGEAEPWDLLGPDASPLWFLPWSLAFIGAGIRIWGAGNLRKNKEVTRTGIYRMVRHPLYLGNCLIYLAFLVSLDGLLLGTALFLVLYAVHYPLVFQEEERLAREYPLEFEAWKETPRFLPNLLVFPEALATDRFSLARVFQNYGLRGLWAPVLLPVVTEALAALRGYV